MNNELFNRPQQKSIRQRLRREMPIAERILWSVLRGSQIGYKFRRQHGIGPYIVDFYCPQCKLIFELDGDSHYSNSEQQRDVVRDAFVMSKKLRVLRFTNTEILENIDAVFEKIKEALNCS